MIYTYAADLRNLKDPKCYPDLLSDLSEHKANEILKLRTLNDRIKALGIALLFKEVLSRHNLFVDDIALDTANTSVYKSISPQECNPAHQKIYFCFSISNNMLICSFGMNELGCNIQKMDDIPKTFSMQYFHRNERKYLESLNAKEVDREFYRIVTLKESYLKMAGESRQQSLKNFEVLIDEDVELYKDGHLEECWFEEYTIPGYRISVCSKDNDFSDIVFINVS